MSRFSTKPLLAVLVVVWRGRVLAVVHTGARALLVSSEAVCPLLPPAGSHRLELASTGL